MSTPAIDDSTTGTGAVPAQGTPPVAADMQDERLLREQGLSGSLRAFRHRVRSGDLGSMPVVVGLVLISVIFEVLSGGTFLSATNLVDLAAQCAAVGPIALGIVLVLLLGEIDLSVGSVSGLAAAILGVMLVTQGTPLGLAVLVALLAGAVIGFLYGVLFTRFGVPSFVITLAGLLAFLGAQLLVLGPNGTINLPTDSAVVAFASSTYLLPWQAIVLVVVAAGGLLVSDVLRSRRRARASLSQGSTTVTVAKAAAVLVGLVVLVLYLATDRGVGLSIVSFVVLVVVMNFLLQRTRWGRAIFAIGGNVEAARRAGINVRAVYISVFMLCSVLAVVGGLVSAGYLSASSTQSGTGDVNLNAIAAAVIGGTSLFGGRGRAWSALLGVVVITAITSGLNLLNIDTNTRFIVTGAVLLLAVVVDSLSRRSRVSHGAA